jgi:histidine triad (HIT) family protein
MSDCLFCKIVAGSIPAKLVYQDDRAVAFRDINPQAPTHILVVPRQHIASLNDIDDSHAPIVGHLHVVAQKLAHAENVATAGYRVLFNTGAHAGQTVHHIHLHLLGGRTLGWPPG